MQVFLRALDVAMTVGINEFLDFVHLSVSERTQRNASETGSLSLLWRKMGKPVTGPSFVRITSCSLRISRDGQSSEA
jgi:hypothetical protein